jgi:MFS family permease
VVGCATLQALAFAPLVAAACSGTVQAGTIFLAATLYWGAGMATGAAWNTWIGTLVPRRIRSRFFALRTRTCQLAVFIGFLAGGLLLQWASGVGGVSIAFAGLFVAALISRLVSVWNLQRQTERAHLAAHMICVPLREIRSVLRASGGGRLLLYLVVVQGMVQISGPYFASFLFKELETSYGSYVLLLSLVYLSKVISLPLWGHVGKRIGAHRLLWLGGIGIIPASGLWICSQNLIWIAILQVAAGACWAAYELGFFLLFFESIDERVRTSILTLYNFLNMVAWVAGAVLGGMLLNSFGADLMGYFWVFGISSIGRAAALFLLARVPPVCVPTGYIELRAVAVRLGAASNDAPVLPSLPEPRRKAA